MNREPRVFERLVAKTCVVAVVAVSLLGGCVSVPAVSGPVPLSPGARQKTIGELLIQWAELTQDAIGATGDTEGWKDDTPLARSMVWDPAAEKVSLPPCSTAGSKDANQVSATVYHAAFEDDPHPVADTLTAYWESQGFTVIRTVDYADGTGWMDISVRATRADGVYYGLTATTEIVAIGVVTECSTHPSIDEWAGERVRQRLRSLDPATVGLRKPRGVAERAGTVAGTSIRPRWGS